MRFLEIKKDRKGSLAQQIFEQFRVKILEGEMAAHEKLPSTRELSHLLNVSRNTVLAAYEMLASEGCVTNVPASGVYVKEGAARTDLSEETACLVPEDQGEESGAPEDVVSFDSGVPALDLIPRNGWLRAMNTAFRKAPLDAFGYDDPRGRRELRVLLANYLQRTRGIHCHPDRVLVTSGTKQGLTLLAKTLLSPGSEVLIEDPSNENVRRIFSYHSQHIVPIPVDCEGIRTDLLPENKRPSCIFVTPSHQFPLGGSLSIQRRVALVQYAQQRDSYIVEDDYDSEFVYSGHPVRSLHELDCERVVYVGTFSKILFPSVRLGYLVLPYTLADRCREWKRLGDHHSNSLYQLALACFIESSELERHILRMKKVYRKRRDLLIDLLGSAFPGSIRIFGETAGMHLVAEFEGIVFSPETLERLRRARVAVVPVEEHAMNKGKHLGRAILGYAHLAPELLREGVVRLRRALER
jgi:GntR family transcriptional regulator/MocR family aminotransferase